jgi:hypothetical protein
MMAVVLAASVTACGSTSSRRSAATAVAYAGGRAYVSWPPGAGAPSDTSVVKTVTETGATTAQTVVAGTDTVVAGLIPGRSYSFRVAGSNGAVTTNRVRAVGAAVPGAPLRPVLTASRTDNQVTVSWRPPSSPAAPERYDIQVSEGTATASRPVGSFMCFAPCTARTVALDPGAVASMQVASANPVGRSSAVTSNQVTVAHPCSLACVNVDATAPGAAETHPAAGFLHSIGPRTPPAVVRPLGAGHWRVSTIFGSTVAYGEETAAGSVPGVDLTELLSDDWRTSQSEPPQAANAGFAVPPWTELDRYQAWITAEVRTVEAVGQSGRYTVNYWEVQNEPFSGAYYSAGTNPALPPAEGGAGETIADFEAQYLAAYRGIKAADPQAKVVAPSLETWAAGPAEAGLEAAGSIDMRTFLDFAVIHHAPPDAIAWHDNNTLPLPDQFAPSQGPVQPAGLEASVAQLRQLLAERPSLGHPAILVNEYGSPTLSLLPGWDVGQLAAVDAAGVTEANRSCFGTCADGYLDGLLAGDGRTPLPGYWVYALYAKITGRKVPVASTFTDVTALATVTPSGSVGILLGRHQGCVPQTPACGPKAVSVLVKVPFSGAATVSVASIPGGIGPLAFPNVQPSIRQQVTGGVVSVTTPAFNDGGAVAVTVTPG